MLYKLIAMNILKLTIYLIDDKESQMQKKNKKWRGFKRKMWIC